MSDRETLTVMLKACRRWGEAEDAWDSIRWEDSGPTKHAAAAELADAKAALLALAREHGYL